VADEQALYDSAPSFADLLPWVEYLPASQSMLLDDGVSLAAFFTLTPIGTEGREAQWLRQVRDALENALQDSFDEHDDCPWVIQLYAQDETDWDAYLHDLRAYVQPRAQDSAFTEFYLRSFQHHLTAIAKPAGLFDDHVVTQLPWRGQTRRVRLVVYRRASQPAGKRGPSPEQALTTVCERLLGGLSNAGVAAKRLDAPEIHAWLLRWFHPHPALLGPSAEDRESFYRVVAHPPATEEDELDLFNGTDFAQSLFFGEPRSDVATGTWHLDGMPHRVIVVDRLRLPPRIGHLTGETPKRWRLAQRGL
jgi:hypothetical protein